MAKSIDTAVILSTASRIRSLNEELDSVLHQSQSTVHSLGGAWTGVAADATISAFDSFAAKYFNKYKEMLNNYVDFLTQSA